MGGCAATSSPASLAARSPPRSVVLGAAAPYLCSAARLKSVGGAEAWPQEPRAPHPRPRPLERRSFRCQAFNISSRRHRALGPYALASIFVEFPAPRPHSPPLSMGTSVREDRTLGASRGFG